MKKLVSLFLLLAVMGALIIVPVSAQDDLLFPIGEGPFHWEDLDTLPDLSGQQVTVFGPWLTADQEIVENIFAYFEYATGAEIIYTGSDGFEQQIVIDCNAGSPDEVLAFPQPGLAANMAAAGCLVPQADGIADSVLENYAAGQSYIDLGTFPDADGEVQFFALPYKLDLKSLVWYVPDNFADAGYEIPQTMEELIALSDQIVEDGTTPWCIGLGSGAATGWPATDWVEDLLLRTQPPEVYDGWVTNEIPFNDERIVNAIEVFGSFAKNDAWVSGGAATVASTDFRDSPTGLFAIPPQCYMHRQASFIPAFFPEGTEIGVDADFFYFPAFESEDWGNPVLTAGTVWGRSSDNPVADALFEFLMTPLGNELYMAQGGFLSAHLGVNLDAYVNDQMKSFGEILLGADVARFDGSDLMPGAIGAGTFWTGMVDYVSGASAQEVADAIQASWDAINE